MTARPRSASARTPGSATTTCSSRSSTKISTGGSHAGCCAACGQQLKEATMAALGLVDQRTGARPHRQSAGQVVHGILPRGAGKWRLRERGSQGADVQSATVDRTRWVGGISSCIDTHRLASQTAALEIAREPQVGAKISVSPHVTPQQTGVKYGSAVIADPTWNPQRNPIGPAEGASGPAGVDRPGPAAKHDRAGSLLSRRAARLRARDTKRKTGWRPRAKWMQRLMLGALPLKA